MKKQLISILRAIERIPRKIGVILIPDLRKAKGGQMTLPILGHCQTDSFSCAVSAGWSALQFLIPESSLKRFDRDCAACPVNGTPSRRLVAALRASGASVQFARMGLAVIRDCLAAGRPILTAIHCSDDLYHWVVIYGISGKMVLLSGRVIPGFSSHWMPWKELRRRNGPWLSLVVSCRTGLKVPGKSGRRKSACK